MESLRKRVCKIRDGSKECNVAESCDLDQTCLFLTLFVNQHLLIKKTIQRLLRHFVTICFITKLVNDELNYQISSI